MTALLLTTPAAFVLGAVLQATRHRIAAAGRAAAHKAAAFCAPHPGRHTGAYLKEAAA